MTSSKTATATNGSGRCATIEQRTNDDATERESPEELSLSTVPYRQRWGDWRRSGPGLDVARLQVLDDAVVRTGHCPASGRDRGCRTGGRLQAGDGYGWQATSSIGFHVQPATDRFPTYVHGTGNYTIDGYTFVVATSSHPKLAGDTVGYAPPGGPIYIETGRTVPDVYETCVHEKLHRTHPSAPHNWIYDVEDRVVDETCLKLLYDLGS